MNMWPEIDQAKGENKRELKLSGADISERIDSNGIDSNLFDLELLNLLNISDTTLQAIPSEISNLINLQTLLLYGNAIHSIPQSIGKLDKLKVLDCSRNKLTNVPDNIGNLQNLTMINLSSNQLTEFPALKNFAKLSVLNLSANKLTSFPDVYSEDNVNLSEIILEDNSIEQIPHAIDQLTTLKHLSLAKNQIKKIPKSLSNISKLKDLELIDNPVADKRLLKLIQQCRTKQVLDYVKQHGEDAPKTSDNANNQTSISNKSSKSKKSKKDFESNLPKHKMIIKRYTDDTIKIIFDDALKDIRPYILCCIVEHVNLTNDKFRKFLQLQTKLHDTVCGKREKSTIATHDLMKLPVDNPFIAFTAKEPAKLQIHPLGKFRKYTGQKLYNDLKAEADALRKEKKRNVYSGIHKYLYLLENKTMFPCLKDSLGNVISLPPLTNGDGTKISPETTSILVEVTSSTSMTDCRSAIDELLKEMLIGGFGAESVDVTEANIQNTLHVQQIKVTDCEGNLRRVYPSKADLEFEDDAAILVERES